MKKTVINGVNYYPHSDGGGLVAETAVVSRTAYIGPDAKVHNQAKISGNASVHGTAEISDKAEIYGYADVTFKIDGSQIYTDNDG